MSIKRAAKSGLATWNEESSVSECQCEPKHRGFAEVLAMSAYVIDAT